VSPGLVATLLTMVVVSGPVLDGSSPSPFSASPCHRLLTILASEGLILYCEALHDLSEVPWGQRPVPLLTFRYREADCVICDFIQRSGVCKRSKLWVGVNPKQRRISTQTV